MYTVFGATGQVGIELTKQLLNEGKSVRAFTRSAKTFPIKHSNLEVVEGDLLNQEDVRKAVHGSEAVFCTIGDGRKGQIRKKGTESIIEAMVSEGVERLICQSTLGAGESYNNLNFFWRNIMFGAFLRRAFFDHIAQESVVMKSGLDWTIVRPAAFTNGPLTGQYRSGFDSEASNLTLKISKADVADFLIKQIGNITSLGKTPGLSY